MTWLLVAGNPLDGFRHYGPFTYPEDAEQFAEAELRNQEWWAAVLHPGRPEGAIGRLERFVASGGDTEVLLEGLPEAVDHDADTHDWELCPECLQQAVEDGILKDARGPIPPTD